MIKKTFRRWISIRICTKKCQNAERDSKETAHNTRWSQLYKTRCLNTHTQSVASNKRVENLRLQGNAGSTFPTSSSSSPFLFLFPIFSLSPLSFALPTLRCTPPRLREGEKEKKSIGWCTHGGIGKKTTLEKKRKRSNSSTTQRSWWWGIAPAWRLTRIPVTYDTIYLLPKKALFLPCVKADHILSYHKI